MNKVESCAPAGLYIYSNSSFYAVTMGLDHRFRSLTMKTPRQRAWLLALNLLAFQVAWFACVLGAARGTPLMGVTVVAMAVGLQFLVSDARIQDSVLTALAIATGLGWDTIMTRAGIVEYASPGPLDGWAPAWVLALWALFATTLREPLRWLHGRWWLAALFGGAGGALSYLAAIRLGAGRFPDFYLAIGVVVCGWAIITPSLTEFARWLGSHR